MDLLARRPHFRAELVQKLVQREYSREEIEETWGRLAEQGIVDDQELTKEFISKRLQRDPIGRRRLLGELQRRGAPLEESLSALDEIFPEDDTELARRVAEKWLRTKRGTRDAMARHLERRGFSKRAIVTLLEELMPKTDYGFSWND